MHDETLDTSHTDTDANGPDQSMRDVVTGPIGSARLVDPAKAEGHGDSRPRRAVDHRDGRGVDRLSPSRTHICVTSNPHVGTGG